MLACKASGAAGAWRSVQVRPLPRCRRALGTRPLYEMLAWLLSLADAVPKLLGLLDSASEGQATGPHPCILAEFCIAKSKNNILELQAKIAWKV